VQVLGIDIGGTGIKAAPVDTTTGKLFTERVKVETPRPAKPDAVAAVVAQHVKNFSWTGPVGIAFPGVVVDGVTMTAANLDPAWVGLDTRALFSKAAGLPTTLTRPAWPRYRSARAPGTRARCSC
jgi:polyphosphate glucokinase